MKHFRDLLVSWGPLGILAVAVIESAGIPNPGGTDLLLLLVTIARPEDAVVCAVLATAGSLIGSLIFYEITKKGGEKLLSKYMSSGRGSRFRAWFLEYGLITVFIPALLPIPVLPFKAFAACAGAMGVKRSRFMLVLAAARIPRFAMLALLGAKLGENSLGWAKDHVWHLVSVAVALFLILYGFIRATDRKRVESN
jgi:membrane protein DedA with SNARE-associated domain